MIADKVTTEALRAMAMGETKVFHLPDSDAIDSGKALAYRIIHSERCRFKASSDYTEMTLTLTKLPYNYDRPRVKNRRRPDRR